MNPEELAAKLETATRERGEAWDAWWKGTKFVAEAERERDEARDEVQRLTDERDELLVRVADQSAELRATREAYNGARAELTRERIEHCKDNGVGCAKHPPTLRLALSPGCASWVVDEDCPGLRCVWPAAIERHTCDDPALLDAECATQLRRMGLAYARLLDTRLPMRGRFALLRRVWKAEKLRAKGKITAGKKVEI